MTGRLGRLNRVWPSLEDHREVQRREKALRDRLMAYPGWPTQLFWLKDHPDLEDQIREAESSFRSAQASYGSSSGHRDQAELDKARAAIHAALTRLGTVYDDVLRAIAERTPAEELN